MFLSKRLLLIHKLFFNKYFDKIRWTHKNSLSSPKYYWSTTATIAIKYIKLKIFGDGSIAVNFGGLKGGFVIRLLDVVALMLSEEA